MATLEEITSQMRTAVGTESGLGRTLKFDFKGEGFVFIDKDSVSNDDKPADCTIVVAKEDFEKIAAGQLDATAAFMQGKLKVNGDMGVAMKLGPMLQRARG